MKISSAVIVTAAGRECPGVVVPPRRRRFPTLAQTFGLIRVRLRYPGILGLDLGYFSPSQVREQF